MCVPVILLLLTSSAAAAAAAVLLDRESEAQQVSGHPAPARFQKEQKTSLPRGGNTPGTGGGGVEGVRKINVISWEVSLLIVTELSQQLPARGESHPAWRAAAPLPNWLTWLKLKARRFLSLQQSLD